MATSKNLLRHSIAVLRAQKCLAYHFDMSRYFLRGALHLNGSLRFFEVP